MESAHLRHGSFLAAGAVVVALVVTSAPITSGASIGPSRRQHGSVSWALRSLYRKAVAAKQTSVVIYGPSASADTRLYKAFEREFKGIHVSGVPVVGPPMTAKLAAEFASGKHVADIANTGGTDMVAYAKSGWLRPFTPSTAASAKLRAGDIGPGHTFYATEIAVFVTIYNSSLVKRHEVPTTWAALAEPAWKGKLGMGDPTAVGLMPDVFAHLAKAGVAKRVMHRLKADDVTLYPATEVTGPLTAVAQGEKEIGIEENYPFYLAAKKAGAPVSFSLLKADNETSPLYMGQLKGAPDPLAARLYEDWLFTPQAGKIIATEGSYAPLPGSPAPPGLPPLARVAHMPYIPLSKVASADEAAIVAAKKVWG